MHAHNNSQCISQPCMIGFVTWPPFTVLHDDIVQKRWPSDKANHACMVVKYTVNYCVHACL